MTVHRITCGLPISPYLINNPAYGQITGLGWKLMALRIPQKKIFVALAGNIGTGKSTAGEIIAEAFGFELFHEPVLDNRFLTPYYADMKRWSFTLQMEYLIKRVDHLRQIQSSNRSCVQDRTLMEDPEVFARYLHGLGNMTATELDLYMEFVDLATSGLPAPDKIIHLMVGDENVLLDRIAERGRESEKNIPASFLAGLNGYYHRFEANMSAKYDCDILNLDVAHIDIRHGDGKAMFLDQVDGLLNG